MAATFCLVVAWAAIALPAAHAADHGAAASALKVLTDPASANTATSETAAHASARESLQVQRSETVDVLIRRRWAGWPVKEEVFRHALADLNPGVLPNASNNLLKRGSTLVLPNTEDLRRTLQRHYPVAADLVRVRVEVETEEAPSASRTGTEKRRWVRFP
jgi:Tfp pilus assembly protein FimV